MKCWAYVFHFTCARCQRLTIGKRLFIGEFQHQIVPLVKQRGFECENCGEVVTDIGMVQGNILEAPPGEIKATPDIIMLRTLLNLGKKRKRKMSNNPLEKFNGPVTKVVYWVIGTALSLGLAANAYDGLNDAGWIQHRQEMRVSWDDGTGWIVGEYRNCVMYNRFREHLYCVGHDGLYAVDDQEARSITVDFWGRTDRNAIATWKCQRKESTLTCRALN